jgi:hypothetical protein
MNNVETFKAGVQTQRVLTDKKLCYEPFRSVLTPLCKSDLPLVGIEVRL